MPKKRLQRAKVIETLRLRLAAADTLPQLAVLGILCGVLAGSVIVIFRLLIEYAQASYLPEARPENYEALSLWMRVLVPTLGGLLIGLIFHFIPKAMRQVGVVHVIERLGYHQGHLPLRNAAMQFIGAGLSIASGHSVGREGPGVHLGAASSSVLGQWLGLPNNSIRTLVACGAAAAIAAGFNTPIAGVIFAMEVVLMEYTIAGFVPVILAAVSGTALTRLVFGSAPAFSVPPLTLGSVLELPIVLAMGVAIGALAALFIYLLQFFTRRGAVIPFWLRATLGGFLTGMFALAAPAVMGIGYDTVNSALLGELGLWVMLGVVLFKLLATTAGLGLGLPGGLIGPTLVIGAAAGGAIGLIVKAVVPGDVASHAFYAMIGMGAMMGATLQAPLAALMAMLELTANPNIILPGMLAVIGAGLINSELFKSKPVYLMLLQARGLDYRNDPVAQTLRRTGVAKVMDKHFVIRPPMLDRAGAKALLAEKPRWIVVSDEAGPQALLPVADLEIYLEEHREERLNLLEIPARRKQLAQTHLRATLQEAIEVLEKTQTEALYVVQSTAARSPRILGVLTRQDIEESYRY